MNLPLDIWRRVAQFLSDSELKRLYPVNRAFYCISMELRYHEVSIGNALSLDPTIWTFIQSLKITPNPLMFLVPYTPSPVDRPKRGFSLLGRQLAPGIAYRIRAFLFRRHVPDQKKIYRMRCEITQKLHQCVSSLGHLTNLSIQWETKGIGWESFLPTVSLLTTGWETFGTHLRHLTLSVPIEIWPRILIPSLRLNVLESLTLRVEISAHNTDDNINIQTTLLPFICMHTATLRTLVVSSHQNLNLTTFYLGVGYLPCLSRFEIEQPYQPIDHTHSDGLHRFLKKHLYQLDHFRWTFLHDHSTWACQLDEKVWFAQWPYRLTLPKIRVLELGLLGLPQYKYANRMFAYVGRHIPTLTTLLLGGWIFDATLVDTLLKVIASPLLKELELSIRVLTSKVVAALSDKVPNLSFLKIGYAEVGRHQINWGDRISRKKRDPPIPPVNVNEEMALELQYFGQDMEIANLVDWPLQVIRLEKLRWYVWHYQPVDEVAACLLKGLPSVAFLNGRYREEFL